MTTLRKSALVVSVGVLCSVLGLASPCAAATATPSFSFAFGTAGSGNGQFNAPVAVATDSETGDVYVADDANNRVQEFTSRGAYLYQWSVANPVAVAVDSTTGAVYADALEDGSIYVLDSDGTTTLFASGFDLPESVAVNQSSGNVYVLDTYASTVDVFTSSGASVTSWGSSGNGNGQVYVPLGIAVSPVNGHVYVSDTGNGRIEAFTSSGTYVRQWAGCDYCKGLTIDRYGHVYVAQNYGENIDEYTSAGKLMVGWGTYGTKHGEFKSPSGVALYGSLIYVADGGNNRIDVSKK